MGTFKKTITIAGTNSGQSRDIEATVDTGAFFTTAPASMLRELGIEPVDTRTFIVADGRRVRVDIGEARVTLDGRSAYTMVAFGEEDAPPLLGALTLETFILAVDPVGERLVPIEFLTL